MVGRGKKDVNEGKFVLVGLVGSSNAVCDPKVGNPMVMGNPKVA